MPLDVLGRTRATLTEPASLPPWPEGLGNLVKLCRDGDRTLQLLFFNEEYLVSVSHQLALITSLPFACMYRGPKVDIKVSASHRKMATLSNCGNVLKLQQPSMPRKRVYGQGNDLGYGKIVEDATMDNPQPSPKSHCCTIRYGCSSQTKCKWAAVD